jgi:hypothetical protein
MTEMETRKIMKKDNPPIAGLILADHLSCCSSVLLRVPRLKDTLRKSQLIKKENRIDITKNVMRNTTEIFKIKKHFFYFLENILSEQWQALFISLIITIITVAIRRAVAVSISVSITVSITGIHNGFVTVIIAIARRASSEIIEHTREVGYLILVNQLIDIKDE